MGCYFSFTPSAVQSTWLPLSAYCLSFCNCLTWQTLSSAFISEILATAVSKAPCWTEHLLLGAVWLLRPLLPFSCLNLVSLLLPILFWFIVLYSTIIYKKGLEFLNVISLLLIYQWFKDGSEMVKMHLWETKLKRVHPVKSSIENGLLFWSLTAVDTFSFFLLLIDWLIIFFLRMAKNF